MKRRRSRIRTQWGPPTVYETILRPSSVQPGTDREPCRVCSKPIFVGDPCFGRSWHIGFAHAACGWYTPADLSYEVRDAIHRCARGETVSPAERALLVRGGWAKASIGEVEWTERGACVYRQFLDIVASTWKEAS